MPDIANLNIPAAAANDAPSRAVKNAKSPVNAHSDGLSQDVDTSSPSFKHSLEEAQTQAAVKHESANSDTPQQQGGNRLPETAASSGKQEQGAPALATDTTQAIAPASETAVLQPATVTTVDKVITQDGAINTQNQATDTPALPVANTAQLPTTDAGTLDTIAPQATTTETPLPTDADATEDAVAVLPAAVSNGLAQQAVKSVAAGVDESLNKAAHQSAASQLHVDKQGQAVAATQKQVAMQSGGTEHAAVKPSAESDMLFKLSMQAMADAPASGLHGGAAQSTTTLSSVNTMQALLQPDAALRGDNPSLTSTTASALAGGQGASQGVGQSLSPSGSLNGALTSSFMNGHIATPFGKPEWGQALGKQVMMMVNQNVRSAEIRMNPANLGPVEIQIDMQDDQVNVAFSSRHAVVREAMEQAMPRLREMLDSNGLSLADSSVSDQSFAEQREFAFAGGQHDNDKHASGLSGSRDDELPEQIASPVAVQSLSSAMLDVYT